MCTSEIVKFSAMSVVIAASHIDPISLFCTFAASTSIDIGAAIANYYKEKNSNENDQKIIYFAK